MVNTIFSQKDSDYLKSQRLARIATVAPSSEENGTIQPDVVPVGFDFDGEYICRWNEPCQIYKVQKCSEKQ